MHKKLYTNLKIETIEVVRLKLKHKVFNIYTHKIKGTFWGAEGAICAYGSLSDDKDLA